MAVLSTADGPLSPMRLAGLRRRYGSRSPSPDATISGLAAPETTGCSEELDTPGPPAIPKLSMEAKTVPPPPPFALKAAEVDLADEAGPEIPKLDLADEAGPAIPKLSLAVPSTAPLVPLAAAQPAVAAPLQRPGVMVPFERALDVSDFPAVAPKQRTSDPHPCDGIKIHPTILERYEPQQQLGQGGYAVVFGVRENASGQLRVIKKINDAFFNAVDAQRCFREVAFQRAADHPNILPLESVSVSRDDLYLICSPMAMDLATAVRHSLLPKPAHKQCVLYQLLCALGYMHTCGVVHRDLKPANVLLDLDCRLKLCDFGLCRTTPKGSEEGNAEGPATPREAVSESDGGTSESVGSRWYRAPEVLLGASVYGPSADLWSFGCVAAEVLGGKTLLLGSTTANQLAKILQVSTAAKWLSEEQLSAMRVPAERAEAAFAALPSKMTPTRLGKLLPGVTADGLSLVQSLLQIVPADRADYAAILAHPYLATFLTEERSAYAAASAGTAARFVMPIEEVPG